MKCKCIIYYNYCCLRITRRDGLRMYRGSCREVVIHFELYRRLKNVICSSGSLEGIKFDVEPEFPVKGGAVNPLVRAVLNGSIINLLVIEVKRWTNNGLSLFTSLSEDQVKEYAKSLPAVYYDMQNCNRLNCVNLHIF